MGCDIHMSIEYRFAYSNNVEGNNKMSDWWCWGKDITGVRDYDMFGYLAGVRNHPADISPLIKPRGVPKDIGYELKEKIEEYGSDGHTHTWMTPKEYSMACSLNQVKDIGGPYDDVAKEWIILREVLNTLEKHYGENNVRLIMFFDN